MKPTGGLLYMKTIEDLKPLRMYSPKTKLYAPVNVMNKRKGAAILLLTRSTDESEMIMNLPYIYNPNLFVSYYISKNVNAYIKSGGNVEIDTNDLDDDTSLSTEEMDELMNESVIMSKNRIPKIKYDNESCSTYDIAFFKDALNDRFILEYTDKLRFNNYNKNPIVITVFAHKDPDDFISKTSDVIPYSYYNDKEIHLLSKSSWEANCKDKSYTDYIRTVFISYMIKKMNPRINLFLSHVYASYIMKNPNYDVVEYTNIFNGLDKLEAEFGESIIFSSIYKGTIEPAYKYMNSNTVNYIKNSIKSTGSVLNEISINDAIQAHGYFYDERWNAIIAFNGDLYRDRVETLVFDKKDMSVYLYFRKDGIYDIPGGSVNKGVSNDDQVANECREEARINIKNQKNTELIYLVKYDSTPEWMKDYPIKWSGAINRVYVADYDGQYSGRIDDIDKDTEMYKFGKFYKIEDVYKLLNPVHKAAVMSYLKSNNLKIRLPLNGNSNKTTLTESGDRFEINSRSNLNESALDRDGYIVEDDYFAYKNINEETVVSFFNQPEYITEAIKINKKFDDVLLRKYLYKERIRTNRDLTAMYADIKARNPWIKRTYPYINRYMGFNIYIDFSYYHSLFLKNNMIKNDKGVGVYWDVINRLLDTEEINKNYNKQTIIIPVNANSWGVTNPEDLFNFRVSINPISTIVRLLRSNPMELHKWDNKKILFVSTKGFFTMDFGTFSMANINRFKKFIRMLMNFEPIEYEDDDEDINTDTKAVTINKALDNIEKSTGVRLSNSSEPQIDKDIVNIKSDLVSGTSIRVMSLTKAKIILPIVNGVKNLVYYLTPNQDSTIKSINKEDNISNKKEIKNITII